MIRRFLALLVAVVGVIVPVTGPAGVALASGGTYTITEIAPAGGSARAVAISPNGTVAGEMIEDGSAETVPFVWRDGIIQRLPLPAGYTSGLALGVNDSGVVAGGVIIEGGYWRAVIWTSGVPQLVGPIDSLAFAVDAAGGVVGRLQNRPVRWVAGIATELGSTSDSDAQAEGLNELGVAVGSSLGGAPVPLLWKEGTRTALPLPPGDSSGEAYTINDGGVAAGWTMREEVSRPVLWDAAGPHLLPTPTGWQHATASDVNAAGDVVGNAWGEAGGRAFIWRNGAPIDLNTLVGDASGWDLTETFQNDDSGRIIGVGLLDGVERGYLLTPARLTYRFDGFKEPVDNDALNVATAGQIVPLKFSVLDADGAPVANLTTFKLTVRSLACERGVTADQLEEYWVGSTGLNNLGGGDYVIGWKTPKSYADSCKTLVLVLDDGVEHTAAFAFTR